MAQSGGDSVFMLDCLFRVFGHQTLEANLAELQERFPSLAEEAKQMAVAEELRWAACPAKEAPPSKRRWDLANMLMAHTRQVWVLRDLLHHALRRRGKPLKRDRPTSSVERQDRLEDFFATLKQSPRKVYPEGHQPLIMDKFWESLEESSMATTAPSCWKDRASRSRCSATASTWDSHWSQHMPEEQLEDISMNTSLPRKKSTGGIVLPPVVQTPPSGGSVAVTAATQKFNYLELFPDLANRKPQPTRRLHFTEVEGGSKSDWTIDEVLVHLKTPEKEESVAAPSELSEARRLLQLDEKPSRRNSMRSMSISMSDSQLVSTLKTTSKPAPPVKKAAFGKPQGIAQHLMSLGEEELQARLLTREPDGCDPSPQRVFDRRFRRDFALPVLPPVSSRPGLRATTHGLPPIFHKGSSWEPEREHPKRGPLQTTSYLRTCLKDRVLPELLPFFTGHSKRLDADGRQLSDHDVLAIAGMLHTVEQIEVINLSNNGLLTDKSMATLLEAALQRRGLAELRAARCGALGPKSAAQVAALLAGEAGRYLRVLDISGVALGLAAQVHLAASIREHDQLRELSLADTQLSGTDCLESIAGNASLELLDLGWNSFDERCFRLLGQELQKNSMLQRLLLPRCCPSRGAMAPLLEDLSGVQGLKFLDIAANQIDYQAALILEDVLQHHPCLKKMNVSENPLGVLGLRSLLRLLCSEGSLLAFDGGSIFDEDGHMESDKAFRASSPGGVYQLDFSKPYHRSLLRVLAKTAERLRMQLPEALTMGGLPLPEKAPDGTWTVPCRGAAKVRFNVERSVNLTEKWNFAAVLEQRSLRLRVPARKQVQLLMQFSSLRCQIHEQVVFLNALSKDFLLEPAQLLQFCWEKEIAEEAVWRLLHCVSSQQGRFLTLLAAPNIGAYVGALRQTSNLLHFNAMNPSGHYSLDLAKPCDFAVGQDLVLLDRWEQLLRAELKRRDVGRRSSSCMFDEFYQGDALTTGLAEWSWPEHGLLEFEYASGQRPGEAQAMASPAFRQLCKALLCCSLPATEKVAALRQVSHRFLLSAFQLRSLCWLLDSARTELYHLFLLRLVDIQNLKLVHEALQEPPQHLQRFNQCMVFPYIQLEEWDFNLNLRFADHRLACLAVFKLCEAEGWSRLQDPAFAAQEEDTEADFWKSSKEVSLDSLPWRGTFRGRFTADAGRNLKCRRQLLEGFGYWPSNIPEEQIFWCCAPQAPDEVWRMVEWLLLHMKDVVKVMPQIIKKVPGGVQTAGCLSCGELERGLKALGFKRLSSLSSVFSYLTSSETMSQADWKKLEPFCRPLQLAAQDFIAFMQSIAGDSLEDWWRILAPEATEVSRVQWNDACRSLGFCGDASRAYELLEEEDERISWTEFQQLQQFV